jgi:hypothetical protein
MILPVRRQALRASLALAVAATALLTASCGSGRKTVYPVRGKVLDARQKGAAGAVVYFNPLDPNYGDLNKPVGKVAEDGTFTLTTYEQGDGAPAGEYAVTIVWPTPRKTPLDPEGGDQLQGKFADPKSSTIRFTVKKEPGNDVPDILLP